MTDEARLDAYERRFRRAGLPLLIEDYSASTNVFNRAVPLLVLVFFGEMLGATSLDWSFAANVGAALGGLAILLCAGAILNRIRGRRAFALPDDVGRIELGVFVLLPALLPLAFGGQWRSALVTAAANAALLVLIYGAVEVRSLERDASGVSPELDRRQRLNVGLVLFVSQALQVLLVSLAVGAFFVVLGTLLIDAGVLESWIGSPGHVLVTIDVFGHQGVVTEELLRVSGAIAAFTGLYFAISMLTDEVYRREFLDGLTREMRDTFKARAEYLRVRAGADVPAQA